MTESRTQGCTALVTDGYGASLVTYEEEAGRVVRRVICVLSPADVPQLEAALRAVRRAVGR
jgi:hypothetical protein